VRLEMAMPNLHVPELLENLHLVTAGQRPHTAPLAAAPCHGLGRVPSGLLAAEQSRRALGRKVRVQACAAEELLPSHADAFHGVNCFLPPLEREPCQRCSPEGCARRSQLRQKQPSFKTEAFTAMLWAGPRCAQLLSGSRQLGLATRQFS